MAISQITYDALNTQEDYMFIAEDSNGESHIGYVYIEKPWYSPKSMWLYYIRKEQYNNGGFCGGAESSGFVNILVDGNTIREWNQIEKIKYDLKNGFRVRLVGSALNISEHIVEIESLESIPYELWEIK